jgi:hypothetical protein
MSTSFLEAWGHIPHVLVILTDSVSNQSHMSMLVFLTWKKFFRTKLWTTFSILPFRSAWILKPDSLPSSYISFLNKHGGKDISIVKGFKELALKIEPFTALKAIEEHYKSTGVDLQLDPQMSIPCKVMTTPLLHKQPIILYGNHLHLCTLWLEAVCWGSVFSLL